MRHAGRTALVQVRQRVGPWAKLRGCGHRRICYITICGSTGDKLLKPERQDSPSGLRCLPHGREPAGGREPGTRPEGLGTVVLGRGAEEEPLPSRAAGRRQHLPSRSRRPLPWGHLLLVPRHRARGSPPLPACRTDALGAGEEAMLSTGVVTVNRQLLFDNIPN